MARFFRSISKTEWAGVGLLLAVGAFLRLWAPDLGYLSLHTSRDLYRSLELLRGVHFPLLGSELQYGGRVLGPLMYLLCAIPLSISMSPVSVAVFMSVLSIGLIAVLWVFVRAYFGRGVALWTLAFYVAFPINIAQLRFNWNPCFLPLMVTGAMIGLFGVAIRRRAWHFLTLVLFICLGLQLEISAAELVLSAGILLAVARVKIPWKVWAVSGVLVLVLFTPLIVHEVTVPKSDLAAVVQSPDTHRPWNDRIHFNPNGIRNFFYHVRLQMNERGDVLGFAYLQIVPLIGEKWLGRTWMTATKDINTFAQIQLLFWFAGIWVCFLEIRKNRRIVRAIGGRGAKGGGGTDEAGGRRGPSAEEQETAEKARQRKLIYLTLIVWQIVPVTILSFFNYTGYPGDPPTLVPVRYYLTTYPAPFITSAVGVVGLASWFQSWGKGVGPRRLRPGVYVVAGALVLSQVAFDGTYLTVLGRSGRFLPYQWPNLAPNLRSMMGIRDILLGKAKIDRDAWYERVSAENLGLWKFGEATFDWLVTQDPRSVTNPPLDPHLRWLLFSPFKRETKPKLPEGAKETRRWTLDDTGMVVVEYRVENPDSPMPPTKEMHNFYYNTVRMRYLGPEKNLRERGGS